MTQQKSFLAAALLLGIGVLLGSCGSDAPEVTAEEATLVRAGDAAPHFTVTTLAGESVQVGRADGNLTVLSFFATWCPPCREELPHLEKQVWVDLAGPHLEMLGIAREHTADELSEFVEQMGLSFPIAPDPSREIYAKFADAYIPRTVVIGPDGVILHHAIDYTPEGFREMVELIEAELGKLRAAGTDNAEDPVA
jgi:peroxiredoxin